MAARDSHFWTKALFWLAVIATLVGWFPVFDVLSSMAIAQLAHCQVDEGSVHPCVLYGTDLGEFLTVLFVSGWYFFVTFPVAIASVVLWLVVWFLRWRRSRA